jgi:hypothetical protein
MKASKSHVGAKTQMLRLDSHLWEQIAKQAAGAGRTPRQEIERRLRESLTETTADRLSPARALSRLIEPLANDLASHSQTAEEWLANMKAANTVLTSELLTGFPQDEGLGEQQSQDNDHSLAESIARRLAQKVLRAHLKPSEDYWTSQVERMLAEESPSLGLKQDELLRIQKAFGLSPEQGRKK